MKVFREKEYRAYKIAQSIINQFGNVNPNNIPIEMMRKHVRRRCKKSRQIARVMEQIQVIRDEKGVKM